MARFCALVVLLLVLFASCLEGRKLHIGSDNNSNKKVEPSSKGSLFLSSLPKGKVPSSTPSKRGNSIELDEKLVARRHLLTTDQRFHLRSVPSPGAGH